MKRLDLERHPREHGCVLHDHGAKHEIWFNLLNLAQAPVPLPRRLFLEYKEKVITRGDFPH